MRESLADFRGCHRPPPPTPTRSLYLRLIDNEQKYNTPRLVHLTMTKLPRLLKTLLNVVFSGPAIVTKRFHLVYKGFTGCEGVTNLLC
jgi:hypothetical protein